MQHLPFANLDALITKAKHVEAALNANIANSVPGAMNFSSVPGGMNLPIQNLMPIVNVTSLEEEEEKCKGQLETALQKALSSITRKIESVSLEPRGSWSQQNNHGRRPGGNNNGKNNVQRCFTCNRIGHFKRDCYRNQQGNTNRSNWSRGNSRRSGWQRGRSSTPGQRSNSPRRRSPSPYHYHQGN